MTEEDWEPGADMLAVIYHIEEGGREMPLNDVIAHFTEPLIPLRRLSPVLLEMLQEGMLELTVDRKLRLTGDPCIHCGTKAGHAAHCPGQLM